MQINALKLNANKIAGLLGKLLSEISAGSRSNVNTHFACAKSLC